MLFSGTKPENEIRNLENSAKIQSKNSNEDEILQNLREFLDENGEVDYKKLENLAQDLPKSLNYRHFLSQFENNDAVIIKTPIKDLEVNPRYMFYHLTKTAIKKAFIKETARKIEFR